MRSSTIKIVLIEDDHILRHAYESLINNDECCVVVNTYSSFDDAEKSLKNDNPEVILLDIELPGMNGVDAISVIKKIVPKAYIIMLTVYEFEEQIFTALTNGASGYLTKNTSVARIIEAIKEVKLGGGPMSSNIARMVIKSFQKSEESPLSKRETQILEMISSGKNRRQVADALFIDPETVKSHLKNIYGKLNVNSKADAIETAKKNRLI